MPRLSVAVWPSPEVIAVLAVLDRPAIAGVRWSLPEQWTVKLRPLGYLEGPVIQRLRDVLVAELDGAPAVHCVLGPMTRRLGGQWLGAPVEGLDSLAAVVFEVTEQLVPVTHPQPFQADVVLARGRVPKELAGQPVAASWTVDAVCLVADRSSPRAPRYEDLAVIALG
ncbi:MAG: 2'-5' RNA ligase family protein [Pseudonocardiaceae bacterium]